MDKYEYQVCADQIKSFIAEKKYVEAMEIADTIDWRRVKSVSMLCTVSEIYKYNKRYEESREILLLAYDRHPSGRMIIYSLCELSIKINDVVSAVEYYKEFVRVAPGDTGSYILLYKIYEAQEVSIEERIKVLEEYKRRDYKEKWAYELAKLYHITGQESKCIDECDELILWFGEGKYVQKAMALKAKHQDFIRNSQKNAGQPQLQQYIPYSDEQQDNEQYGMTQGDSGELLSNAAYDQTGEVVMNREVTAPGYNTEKLQNELQQSMEQYLGKSSDTDFNEAPSDYSSYTDDKKDDREATVAGNGITVQQVEGSAPEKTQEFVFDQNKDYVQQFMDQFQEAARGVLDEQKEKVDFARKSEPAAITETLSGSVEENENEDPANDGIAYPENEQDTTQGGAGSTEDETEAQNEENSSVQQSTEPEGADDPSEKKTPDDIISKIRKKTAKKYDGLLGQEYNGQIRISLPDTEMVEKQITGQIDVEEILRKRKERYERLGSTDKLLSQLNGVIPGSVSEDESENTKDSLSEETEEETEEKTLNEEAGEEADTNENTGEISDINNEETEDGEALEETGNTEALEETEASPEDTEAAEALEETEDTEASPEDTEAAGALEETEDTETLAEDTEEAQTLEETGETDLFTEEAEEDPEVLNEESGYEPEIYTEDNEEKEDGSLYEEITQEDTESPQKHEMPTFGYELDDYGEVEEIEDIEQPDEVDDIIKTSNLPLEEIAEYNAMAEHAIYAENNEPVLPSNYDENGRMKHPSYMVLEEARKSRRDFDEDEYKLFGRYDGIESVKAQLVDIIDDMSMKPDQGNVVVMGDEVSCRKTLSIDIVKAMQMVDSTFTGKVAKISGEAFNKKNIPATLKKLDNGALIIEEAGGLSAAALTIISQSLSREVEGILIVLEGSRETLMPLLETNPMMFSAIFDARIDIEEFSNDDLVAYAKGYAREQEHSIDEMGTLALYTRIGELQTMDNKVTVEDIKELIDNAISRVDKMSFAHLIDVLVSKRYDDDDFIIIREKDFLLDGRKQDKTKKKGKKKKEKKDRG